jgi:hypothetical protein
MRWSLTQTAQAKGVTPRTRAVTQNAGAATYFAAAGLFTEIASASV